MEGCLEWQRDGLSPPPAVTDATEAYFTEEDGIGRFITQCCERNPMALVELKHLYPAYKTFCEILRRGSPLAKVFQSKT